MWNDFSRYLNIIGKLLPPSTTTNTNVEASIYNDDMKIVGVITIFYDTNTKDVGGYVLMDAINPLPVIRFDISRDGLKGQYYWKTGSKKLLDGDVEVRINGDNFVGHRSNPYWPCNDFFIYSNKNGLGI